MTNQKSKTTNNTATCLLAGRFRRCQNGFTLVEILVFTAIVSVFFVVAAAVSAFSLNIMRTNENRLYATHYAEEAIEWVGNQKETLDWTAFCGYAADSPGVTRCLNTLAWAGVGACLETDYSLGATYSKHFNRNLLLTKSAVDCSGNIAATVTVSWKDIGGNIRSVPVTTIYSQLE